MATRHGGRSQDSLEGSVSPAQVTFGPSASSLGSPGVHQEVGSPCSLPPVDDDPPPQKCTESHGLPGTPCATPPGSLRFTQAHALNDGPQDHRERHPSTAQRTNVGSESPRGAPSPFTPPTRIPSFDYLQGIGSWHPDVDRRPNLGVDRENGARHLQHGGEVGNGDRSFDSPRSGSSSLSFSNDQDQMSQAEHQRQHQQEQQQHRQQQQQHQQEQQQHRQQEQQQQHRQQEQQQHRQQQQQQQRRRRQQQQ